MKSLTIRNIPDDLYRIIVKIAQRNHRNIQQQALFILDKIRLLDNESPILKAKEIRKRLEGRKLGDTIDEIHQERMR